MGLHSSHGVRIGFRDLGTESIEKTLCCTCRTDPEEAQSRRCGWRWLSPGSLPARRWEQTSRNQKQSSHNRGKAAVTADNLARTVSLRALGTQPGDKKEQHESQGMDTYPGSSFTDGDGITQPDKQGREENKNPLK